ncbi:DUF6338 family protein [Vibrio sp. L3-7]|uniref:DUF6338 family protein n=1 Tax=Vibrio sp. L3-7 TaxID=2912253 RepID=UPI001F43850B|nr:DUF6338 family protein [Vibrio sp. L3-7]MCF7507299.1 DUF6338 family protein [Vibrio sp. L3-7]
MENLSNNIIVLLQYLLPGFVAAWMFYSLTSYPKPSQFERIVQALIFTIFIQAIVKSMEISVSYLKTQGFDLLLPEQFGLVGSVTTALVLGFLFVFFANNDYLHGLLRKANITRETSYPSEWFGAFLKDITYVVLHLEDERRLYGWPKEWPSEPTSGYFVITDPTWLNEDGSEISIPGVKHILIDANDVKWVEFMEKNWE